MVSEGGARKRADEGLAGFGTSDIPRRPDSGDAEDPSTDVALFRQSMEDALSHQKAQARAEEEVMAKFTVKGTVTIEAPFVCEVDAETRDDVERRFGIFADDPLPEHEHIDFNNYDVSDVLIDSMEEKDAES